VHNPVQLSTSPFRNICRWRTGQSTLVIWTYIELNSALTNNRFPILRSYTNKKYFHSHWSKLLYDWRSISQSVSIYWYWAPLWDLRPDITPCRNVAVWILRSCFCGAPSLTRGRVCNLQCNHSMVRVAENFTVSSETPPTWRAKFLYLHPPGAGWPSYSPGHWVHSHYGLQVLI
jgi:hypothetical protein